MTGQELADSVEQALACWKRCGICLLFYPTEDGGEISHGDIVSPKIAFSAVVHAPKMLWVCNNCFKDLACS